MIIVQNVEGEVISIHTTVPAFCRYYQIDSPGTEKSIREKLLVKDGKPLHYTDFIINKKNPV